MGAGVWQPIWDPYMGNTRLVIHNTLLHIAYFHQEGQAWSMKDELGNCTRGASFQLTRKLPIFPWYWPLDRCIHRILHVSLLHQK